MTEYFEIDQGIRSLSDDVDQLYYDYYYHNRAPGWDRTVVDYGSSMYPVVLEQDEQAVAVGCMAHVAQSIGSVNIGGYLSDLITKARTMLEQDTGSKSSTLANAYQWTVNQPAVSFTSAPLSPPQPNSMASDVASVRHQLDAAQAARNAGFVLPLPGNVLAVAPSIPGHGSPAAAALSLAYARTSWHYDALGRPLETGIEGLPRNSLLR